MSRALAALRRTMFAYGSSGLLSRYLRESVRPVHILVFLLPVVVLYEAWGFHLRRIGGDSGILVAHSALRVLLEWFGILGFWVPGVILVVTLLVLQTRRRDRWRIVGWVPVVMTAESILLALPLLAAAGLLAVAPEDPSTQVGTRLILALGAGVYEELVFRLLLIAGLLWLMGELAHLRGAAALALAVPAAALVFTLCHFPPIGADPFRWTSFWFRLVAGLYLGLIYAGRGLGVAAGVHATFNAALVLLR